MLTLLHALIVLAILLITANTVFLFVRRGCAVGGEDRCKISEFYQLMVHSYSGTGAVMVATIAVFF